MKHLRDKDITLVKVIWEGPVGGSMTWELESQMRVSYPTLFPPSNFRGQTLCNWGRVITP